MSNQRIAVVGIACRYPDAESPDQMWQNVLAGRRAFRRLPDVRMRREDYYSPDLKAPDRHNALKAAVIEGFEFDRVKHKIAGSTFRSTDMVHWLALDTASNALEDAGFPEGKGLGELNAGVIIGNSLNGEFSRANVMRLRWPYVRRTVGAALREQGWDDAELAEFLAKLEQRYKQPFPGIDEDTLAGGLANTIAGRICNHYDFRGGGYTVDGACSSSLLAVATASNALASGQLDIAIAGGVDLSIDPFEVIGFAKTDALTKSEMRVYDKNSNGFWPGEGCGMVVLMREEDAVAQNLRRHATIAGWGYSSDGKGGMTRPEASGHQAAIKRAYTAAGFGVETVKYFEGHGTGTAVGDATELRAISGAVREANPGGAPAAISTLKGNIGHTKAAAGVGGLLKAILAVRNQVIPPATGHYETHPVLADEKPALRVPDRAALWPEDAPVRAGVSSMGFGGINAHIVVESAAEQRQSELPDAVLVLERSRQDVELLLVDAADLVELRGKVAHLASMTPQLSYAELGDLAATLQGELADRPLRAAIVVNSPEEAERKFGKLLTLLDSGARSVLDAADGVYLGNAQGSARIGFLFPGQGAGRRADGGALRRRFAQVDELYETMALPTEGDLVDTAVAQPRIVTGSVAALRILSALGIEAVAAAGHSLGELTALHWAGSMDESTLLRMAAVRGSVMSEASEGNGTMASIAAPASAVEPLLAGEPVVIAGYNSPKQTVISGPYDAVERVSALAARQDLHVTKVNVSHAFHSQLVAPAAAEFGTQLAAEAFGRVERRVVSTVTGEDLAADTDVAALLTRQITDPVRFADAVQKMASGVDLLLEVGPGRILRNLAVEVAPVIPAISLDADSPSLAGLLNAVAAAYTLGASVNTAALFEDRFVRPLPLDKQFKFFASPAEYSGDDFVLDMSLLPAAVGEPAATVADPALNGAGSAPKSTGESSLEVLIRLAAERAELPISAVSPNANPLDELHLSSITVGQIMNQASREIGLTTPLTTSAFATSTIAELAAMLDELADTSHGEDENAAGAVAGVAPWVRAFAIDMVAAEPGRAAGSSSYGDWQLFASDGHPIAAALQDALRKAKLGDGVLLCLPRDTDEQHAALMLSAARAALSLKSPARFVAVGDRRGAAGLAKTLHLESPSVATTVVTLPLADDLPAEQVEHVVSRIVKDVAATERFAEVQYDAAGVRRVPVLRPLAPTAEPDAAIPLGKGDVLLVTGGGKGITAECALALARDTGVAVGLMGRSDPADDSELAANLERMQAAGVTFKYVHADVTATDEVKAAVGEVVKALGPVTGVLHGAGRNHPQGLTSLDESSFKRTLAPKIDGLEAVLTAVDPANLKLLVSFGSIIGRAGLRGEGDYATANDWLTDLTRRVQEDYPNCKCLSLEWSVWSGSGMGEKLGVLESLMRDGIDPIPTEEGIALLKQVLANPSAPDTLVVMGRASGLPTLELDQRELPLLRFVDRAQVYYPGVELVVDADLSADADLYLADHLLDGDLLFPAVLGMEAMTQTASALTGRQEAPVLENVEFLRPIVVPVTGTTTVRIAVLAKDANTVEAVIRSADTGFQADHFRATLRYGAALEGEARPVAKETPWVLLYPDRDLYGPVLFQGARFQRLHAYRELAAKHCVALIENQPTAPWFAGFLPADLVLGDPGTRDAMMHSIQCNVPDATLLPSGIERLYLADPGTVRPMEQVYLHATERWRDGDTYLYDLDVTDVEGNLVERWEGLRLQAVRKLDGSGPWKPALLGPYLERRTEVVLPAELRVVVHPDGDKPIKGVEARRKQTAKAATMALGVGTVVRHRADGKPEVEGGMNISASHGAGVTFLVAGERKVGCDIELAEARSDEDWTGLLGADGFALAKLVSQENGEDLAVSATRVWGAIESLRKIGYAKVQLSVDAKPALDRWVVLRSGDARIATFPTAVDGVAAPVVFAMLTEGE